MAHRCCPTIQLAEIVRTHEKAWTQGADDRFPIPNRKGNRVDRGRTRLHVIMSAKPRALPPTSMRHLRKLLRSHRGEERHLTRCT